MNFKGPDLLSRPEVKRVKPVHGKQKISSIIKLDTAQIQVELDHSAFIIILFVTSLLIYISQTRYIPNKLTTMMASNMFMFLNEFPKKPKVQKSH